ncbi:MAG: hypothetical protein IJ774_02540 [Selenomonadaceae bacterium]|nr:hypothetical protein [Selenomonadaceae bacterium]
MLEFNTMRFGTDVFDAESATQYPKVTARINGEDVAFLCRDVQISEPSIAFNYGGETYYIYLVDPEDDLASPVQICWDGVTYALATDI